jgi:maltose O-acetyltransferase
MNAIAFLRRMVASSPRNPPCARIDPSARLYPQAQIENLLKEPRRIVIAANSHIRGRLLTYAHGGQITVGEWCYIGVRAEIWSIGNRVLIAHDVNIHDGTAHALDAQERHLHFRQIIEKGHPPTWDELPGVSSAPIVIEDDVWISFGVILLKGVTIGKGSVIAAGSIVTKDVPPYSLYRCQIHPVITPLPRKEDE